MSDGSSHRSSFDMTEFLQSLQTQLDQAQDALALKVRTGRPLTWALKDLSIDLKAFAEVDAQGKMRLRNAGPGEEGASSFKFSFTTITRPMVEENTIDMALDEDPRSLEEIEHAGLIDVNTKQRLERIGVRTVGQLKRLNREVGSKAIQNVSGTPIDRLRNALIAAARPVVMSNHEEVTRDGYRLLHIEGANLSDGFSTEVKLKGEPVEIIESSPLELVVRPLEHHSEGQIEVHVGNDCAKGYFRLSKNKADPELVNDKESA